MVTCLRYSSLAINPKFRSNFGKPKAAKGQAYFAYSIQPELSKDREISTLLVSNTTVLKVQKYVKKCLGSFELLSHSWVWPLRSCDAPVPVGEPV